MSSIIYYSACLALKTNEEIEICPADKNVGRTIPKAAFIAGVMREGLPCTLLFLSVHACGVRVVFVDHGALGIYFLQVTSLHLKPWIFLLALISFAFWSILPFVRDSSGRRKSPAERNALYLLAVYDGVYNTFPWSTFPQQMEQCRVPKDPRWTHLAESFPKRTIHDWHPFVEQSGLENRPRGL